MMVDPLVRGIYYMYLLPIERPDTMIFDIQVTQYIKDLMDFYNLPAYSSVVHVRRMLVKELLRGR